MVALATHMGYDGQIAWRNLDAKTSSLLARLARLAVLQSRFVDEEGNVLEQPEEPLRWHLVATDGEEGELPSAWSGPMDRPRRQCSPCCLPGPRCM